MYIGQIQKTIPLHRDKWIQGIGTFPVPAGSTQQTLEQYACETCGRIAQVIGKADEAFYCKCGSLIQIG